MTDHAELTLVNPQSQSLAFSIFSFEDDLLFNSLKNYGYYSMVLVTAGKGSFQADLSEHAFDGPCLLCFSIYQPFSIKAEAGFSGVLIRFHPDFFCLYRHQEEVACNGVLFNNPYGTPITRLLPPEITALLSIIDSLKVEMQNPAAAQYELLVSWLKIFLINASRIQMRQQATLPAADSKQPFILKTLVDAIEEHFRSKHSPGEYASILNISPKALNRISKTHFNKTLSGLINERIITEAKRELYLTAKPVKAIAYELGFEDEFYFSRFFKNNVAVSPQVYRQTIGFARGESA